jgi:hypothetical protein
MSDYLVKESQVVNTAEVDEEATDDNLIEEAFNE